MQPTQLLLMLVGLFGAPAAQDPANDWLLVAGERVGPIRATASEAELRRLFGSANVVPTLIHLGEGERRAGAIIFPDDTSRRMEIIWSDTLAREAPQEIRLRGARTRWRFANGVTLGSSLRDLERLNGRPFHLSGWGHDGAGIVWDWAGGDLEADLPLTGVRVYFATPSGSSLTSNESRSLAGDRDLASDIPALRRANPGIAFIRVMIRR